MKIALYELQNIPMNLEILFEKIHRGLQFLDNIFNLD